MKKINYILLSAFVIMAITVSCRKEHEHATVTKVVDVMLDANEKYSYTMPASGDEDDVMEISQQAKHFTISQITPDAMRNTLLEYTPELNYTGTDEIHINTVEGPDHNEGHHHGGNQGGFGNCTGHHNDTEINYIFKITVIRATEPN